MIDRLPPIQASVRVLLVDDDPGTIRTIGDLLLKHGHDMVAVSSGEEALEALSGPLPDLVLLDIMLPGMTSFELCRRIHQASADTRTLPVIFLSSSGDKNFTLQALESGAVDCVTKPFHGDELISRVELHANLQRTRRRLAALIEEKNRLLEVVAHDLKNPLGGIQFAAMMLAERLQSSGQPPDPLIESIKDSANRAFEIVGGILDIRGLEELKATIRPEAVCLKEHARQAIHNLDHHGKAKNILVDFHHPGHDVTVTGERRSLLCCLENLISNAIKFSPPGATIHIEVLPEAEHGIFRIRDQGPGIQAEEIASLFGKFTRLSARPTGGEASTGLGLHIVHELIRTMGGSVHYEPAVPGGACFVMTLPLAVRN